VLQFVSGAQSSLEGLLDALPQKVRQVTPRADGSLDWSNQQQVRVDDVDVGSLIVVKPGEVLPLDGVVVEGSALVGECF
jgi:cation transport ATPase